MKTIHGNDARIDPKKDVTSVFSTNNIVAKKPQKGDKVPQPLVENTVLAKHEVDENEK